MHYCARIYNASGSKWLQEHSKKVLQYTLFFSYKLFNKIQQNKKLKKKNYSPTNRIDSPIIRTIRRFFFTEWNTNTAYIIKKAVKSLKSA